MVTKYLSTGQAIKILKIDRRTFYAKEKKGLIEAVVQIGTQWKGYLREDVLNLKKHIIKYKK